jgi:hypothetical protein
MNRVNPIKIGRRFSRLTMEAIVANAKSDSVRIPVRVVCDYSQ